MGWDKSDFIVAGMCPVYLNIKELDAFLGPGSGRPKPQISLYWFYLFVVCWETLQEKPAGVTQGQSRWL